MFQENKISVTGTWFHWKKQKTKTLSVKCLMLINSVDLAKIWNEELYSLEPYYWFKSLDDTKRTFPTRAMDVVQIDPSYNDIFQINYAFSFGSVSR